jgi:DNA-binding response OmpR family regulator
LKRWLSIDTIEPLMEAAQTGTSADRLSELLGFDDTPVQGGHLELLPNEGRLLVDGQEVYLPRREFRLPRVRVIAAGHVLSRERRHAAVWGAPMPYPRDRSVDVHIRRVRLRLRQAAPRWSYIQTHVGHGYRFQPVRRRARA